MENKKGVSKGLIIGMICIILLVIIILVGAIYIHYGVPKDIETKKLDGGNISLTYTDEENLFVIQNAIPTNDLVGTKYDSADLYFDFTVKTEIEEANYIEYEIVLVKDEALSTALEDNIKVYLEKENKGTYVEVVEPMFFSSNIDDKELGDSAMSIYKQKKTTDGNDNYRLRMWIADTAVLSSEQVQNYGVQVVIKGIAK